MTSKRLLSRRAWMTLAWASFWFVAGQVAIRAVLQSRPEIADPEFGRKLVDLRAAIRQQPGRPVVLMLGSSRVATGFRPDSLPRHEAYAGRDPLVFNFAQVGSGPEMAHLSLQRLLDFGIRPDWVLIEFWPPTWGTERGIKEFMDQVNVGCLDWGGVRLLGRYVSRPRRLYRQWWNMQLVPLVTQREALVRHVAPSWALTPTEPDRRCQNLDRLGWWSPMTSVEPEERGRLVERYRRVYEHRLRRYRVAKTPDHALREIVALCDRERIRATVVVLPEGEVFRGLYPDKARRDVTDYLDRIGRECRVQVVDARDWVDDDGFMDGHHLLPEGAAVFTRRLGRDVLQPLLANALTPLRR
jgi:hypothetical protein